MIHRRERERAEFSQRGLTAMARGRKETQRSFTAETQKAQSFAFLAYLAGNIFSSFVFFVVKFTAETQKAQSFAFLAYLAGNIFSPFVFFVPLWEILPQRRRGRSFISHPVNYFRKSLILVPGMIGNGILSLFSRPAYEPETTTALLYYTNGLAAGLFAIL